MDLNGRVAVVTGRGGGLGLAYAKELAAADAIAEVWPTVFAPYEQSVRETLPEPPQAKS